ncbi:hypothetical protein GCM10010464_78970 [Pseudonocardia yunnanensis]
MPVHVAEPPMCRRLTGASRCRRRPNDETISRHPGREGFAEAGFHVYRFGSVPVTLHMRLPGPCGNPTMWATNMSATAAERAAHAVEVLGAGRPERAGDGRSQPESGRACVDG